MVYLLIAFLLLLIVAPIIHVLPSREQKLMMTKRRSAMSQGIGVELVKIDDPDPDEKKYRTSTARPLPRELSVTAYRLHRGRMNHSDHSVSYELLRYEHEGRVHFTGDWYWSSRETALVSGPLSDHLSNHLSKLPGDVVRVEEKNRFISLYWHEAGDVSEVIDFLKRTAEINPAK